MDVSISPKLTCSCNNSTMVHTVSSKQASIGNDEKFTPDSAVDSGYHSWSNISCAKEFYNDHTVGNKKPTVSEKSNELMSCISERPDILNCQSNGRISRGTTCKESPRHLSESHEQLHNSYASEVLDTSSLIHQHKLTKNHNPQLTNTISDKNAVYSSSNKISLFTSATITGQYQSEQNSVYQASRYGCTVTTHYSGINSHPAAENLNDNIKSEAHELAIKIEFCLMFGYTQSQIRAAITKLSFRASKNDILAELSSLQSVPVCNSSGFPIIIPDYKSSFDEHEYEENVENNDEVPIKIIASTTDKISRGPLTLENEHKDNIGDKVTEDDFKNLRPIVIDGSNVAMSHGNKQYFSCKGILLAVDFFRNRNHSDITVFVPTYRKEKRRPDAPIRDREILAKLEEERILVYTPSRCINGKRVTCYDDRFILKLAQDTDGIIVSNDNFRDLQSEKPEWKELVAKRLLMYSFVNDRFMPPDDPLGRNGPSIDNFLRIRPASEEQNKPQCPYGKKCTYGKKCKYFHPECSRSVTDRLKEKCDKRMKVSNVAKQLANELIVHDVPKNNVEKALSSQAKSITQRNLSESVNDSEQYNMQSLQSNTSTMASSKQQDRRNNSSKDEHVKSQESAHPVRLPAQSNQASTPKLIAHEQPSFSHYQEPYDGFSESLRQQLTVASQMPNNHIASCSQVGSNGSQLCYDSQGKVYAMRNESPRVPSSFHNSIGSQPQYVYPREVGPPDFHAASNQKKNMTNQQNFRQYQHSSPANLQVYDGRNGEAPVVQHQHLNMTGPYQRTGAMPSSYSVPSGPVYPNGFSDVRYRSNQQQPLAQQMMYPYQTPNNSNSATHIHQNMAPGPYYLPAGSENSLAHTYPFIHTQNGQVVTPLPQRFNSTNGNSDAKTYPPPHMPRRVYSSPGHQAHPDIRQGHSPAHSGANYRPAPRQQPVHNLLHSNSPPLGSTDNPRHHLFQNLCGLFEQSIVERVMNSNPNIFEPKPIIQLCLNES